MRALKYHGAWNVALEEVPDLRATGPDDVVVDIRFCGICGTDLGIVSGSYPIAVPGVTLGHEATGVVAECGPAVTNVKVGDRVVINPTPYCGQCRMCRTQRINHCVNKMGTESGVSYDGAFADRFLTTSRFVHVLPDHVSLQAAALTEPLSCVLSGVRKIQPPSMAAYTYVFGAGPLGLLYAWALSLKGLAPAVIETSPERLSFAQDRLPDGPAPTLPSTTPAAATFRQYGRAPRRRGRHHLGAARRALSTDGMRWDLHVDRSEGEAVRRSTACTSRTAACR
ncbi:putative D-xylulose reductase A [Streptomyces afghaniensis 772]|uniref:2-deoxy-scyllo-inosamine dehydrogenase n=1 Tax=Streptomyces afghaniensis 772 TaxID=1283301 RepID=S4M5P4_9ACTN|nr:alcohol dehydrogenase catalytic domain-containing protein [Streptomyces afghaniensis]EPJ34553.1 putative D-xylulose reductase A [Streptomyces afghaniensis 772]